MRRHKACVLAPQGDISEVAKIFVAGRAAMGDFRVLAKFKHTLPAISRCVSDSRGFVTGAQLNSFGHTPYHTPVIMQYTSVPARQ